MEEQQIDESTFEKGEENPFITRFENFLETRYKKEIERLVEKYPEKKSIVIDFKHLEEFDFELADDLIENPDYLLEAANLAIQKIDVPALEIDEFAPHIRFFNLPKDRKPLIRDVSSSHLNKLIAVEGVISEITEVMPKLKIAVWQCRRCGNTYKTPQDSPEIKKPAFCECKHRDFSLVPDQSEFIDYQRIKIQEPLEKLRGNEQAANLAVYVSDDQVNMISAGDMTEFTGVLRLNPPKDKKSVYGRFLEVNHLEETEREFEEVEITPEEEEEIRNLSKQDDVYEQLTQSLAPGIFGHEVTKEAIIMQMFGGVRKHMPDGSKIRGNIHVLLVGDPGAAKSMLLKATDNIAPKSIYVAGKTTTGAGISATAVKDDFGEGGWTIKAGALVLASGGMAMVDEFDKMDPDDRSAMHEALEQQSISIAKAGIVTRFKTETSVLAAANPKFSRFDPYEPFIEQIDLPPTLISRFDLFFMIRDVLDRTKDERIAAHILKTHRLGELISLKKRANKKLEKEDLEELEEHSVPKISSDLLKKYISFARQNIFPVLSREATKAIGDFYVSLRDEGRKEGSYSATHRQLEGLVRLSEASARIRLSDIVEPRDAERAIRLVRSSLEGMATDPETNRIDIDIITSGQSHSKVEGLKKVLRIIKALADEQDMVPIEQVIENAKEQGIEEEKARDFLSQLKKKGEIYSPRNHFVKPVGKK